MKNLERYFKSGSLQNYCAIRDISFRKPFSKLYFIESSFICYNALNDIIYLSDIDFKDQIQNSQKMVYLILGHPVCRTLLEYNGLDLYGTKYGYTGLDRTMQDYTGLFRSI